MWISEQKWLDLVDRVGMLSDQVAAQTRLILKLNREISMALTNLDKIKEAVTKANAGIESVLALVNTQAGQIRDLANRLADAIATNDPAAQAAVQADLDTMATDLSAEADKLAAATQAPPA